MEIRTDNILEEKIYCDKFDANMVSSLSLFLYEDYYFHFAKDQNGKILAIHKHPYENLRSLNYKLKEDRLYQLDVPTRVYNFASPFSLIPGPLFDPALSSVFLFFSEKPVENSMVYDTSLESNNLHLVGSIRKDLAEILAENKSEIYFHHGATSFLSFVLKEKFNLVNQEILILIHKDWFFLTAFSNQELILFNRFEVNSKEEILKYIVGITHQLEFNANYCRLTIFGNTSFYGIDDNWVSQYFKNFAISKPLSNIQYQEGTQSFQNPKTFESFWELP